MWKIVQFSFYGWGHELRKVKHTAQGHIPRTEPQVHPAQSFCSMYNAVRPLELIVITPSKVLQRHRQGEQTHANVLHIDPLGKNVTRWGSRKGINMVQKLLLCQELYETCCLNFHKKSIQLYASHRQAKIKWLLYWTGCLLRSDLALICGIIFLSSWDIPIWLESDSQWLWEDKTLRIFITTTTLWWPWPLQVFPLLRRLGRF